MIYSDPKLVALLFNEHINNQDLEKLVGLMTEDHTFIDIPGRVTEGREEMKKGWADFFAAFPDYRNIFSRVENRDNLVIMLGRSKCSEKSLHGPAIWTAKIRDGLVEEWRVYEDSEETRKKLNIP